MSEDFYPTPARLARSLIHGMELHPYHAIVCDPSAGEGALLEAARDSMMERRGGWSRDRETPPLLYAVELDPERGYVLEGKGFPVLATDWLEYTPTVRFTAIVMNPPFSAAEAHFLRAWEFLPPGGRLGAILPASMVDAPRTPREQLVANVVSGNSFRRAERRELAFAQAEHKTNVAVVLVWVERKEEAAGPLPDFTPDQDANSRANLGGRGGAFDLAPTGYVEPLLAAYTAALAAFAEYNQARQRVEQFADFFGDEALKAADATKDLTARHNAFVVTLTEKAWGLILDHPGFQSMLTVRAEKMMTAFRARQGRVDFTPANVRRMLEALISSRSLFLEAAVEDAFDTLTSYHKDNRIHVEGWLSNEAYRVARRVVLPGFVNHEWTGNFRIEWHRARTLTDIDRALSIVTGTPWDNVVTIQAALEAAFKADPGHPGLCESTFFGVRYFKKGTIHLMWKDEQVREDFNLAAARGRQWLPPA